MERGFWEGPRGIHGLGVGLVTVGLLAESDLPFLLLGLLFGVLGVWLVVRGPARRRRSGALVIFACLLLLGYLAWGRVSGVPRTRMEVTEAFARAFVEADWRAASELMVPRERARSEPIFRGLAEEVRAFGVRVGECRDDGWQTGCALDGGTRYQGAIMMGLRRTEEGWRVTSFLPMGGPPPEGLLSGGGVGTGGGAPLTADVWRSAPIPAAVVLLFSLYRARRPLLDRVLASSACALIAVTAGPATYWGSPAAFLRAVPVVALGRMAAAVLLGLLGVELQGLLVPAGDGHPALPSSLTRYVASWLGLASAGLAAQSFPRQGGTPLVPGLLLLVGLAVWFLGRKGREPL